MPTQAVIADHLDLSQPAVSEVMSKLAIDWQAESLDQIRVRYIRHLRDLAAGRGGEAQLVLAQQRARESSLKGDMLELQIARESGLLVVASDFEQAMVAGIAAARSELLTLADKVVAEIKAIHGIDVDSDLIDTHVYAALNRLAEQDPLDATHDSAQSNADLGGSVSNVVSSVG